MKLSHRISCRCFFKMLLVGRVHHFERSSVVNNLRNCIRKVLLLDYVCSVCSDVVSRGWRSSLIPHGPTTSERLGHLGIQAVDFRGAEDRDVLYLSCIISSSQDLSCFIQCNTVNLTKCASSCLQKFPESLVLVLLRWSYGAYCSLWFLDIVNLFKFICFIFCVMHIEFKYNEMC